MSEETRTKILTKKGWEWVTVFKIDLDIKIPKSWMENFIKTRKAIVRSMDFKPIHVIVDETHRGYHVYVHAKTPKLTPTECNMLQFLLGDDKSRVIINQRRIKRGVPWKIGNKMFDHVIWRKEHKCNCDIHQKILKRMKEGQKALMGVEDV